MKRSLWFWGALAGAATGLLFASYSTLDFIAHLDRQLHSLHCSFIPGLGSGTLAAESGCRAVMNSAYSSWFRESYWGGVPISLLALAVFAYLVFLTVEMALGGRLRQKGEAGYLFLASLLPLGMSAIMFVIAVTEVGASCKLCVGIYASSLLFSLSTFMLWRHARPVFSQGGGRVLVYFLEGVAFVGLSVVIYVAALPAYEDKVTSCETLTKPEDKQKALLPLQAGGGGPPVVEIFDPLCPACKAFQGRIEQEQLFGGQPWSLLLFPLDTECNWMLKESLHPGACMLSRALVCAESNELQHMMTFILDHQEEFRITATKAPEEVKQKMLTQFPKLSGCIDSADAKLRVNNMLRFAMNNRVPISTPQVYIGGRRLCDEDTDLGLSYALNILKGGSRGR